MIGTRKEIIDYLLTQSDDVKFELKEHKEKRSLNANSYCWVLLQKLADVLHTTKIDLYKKYIREKGIFRTITIDNSAVDTFIHLWEEKGIGWICEVSNKGNTSTDLIAYYGTSSYNRKQMAHYIDFVVDACKEQGIETMTPQELESLKEKWKSTT
ncbi:MAG: hypothetical protein IKO78_02495 [Bacilli bacterium]|nr:hypothetical protein [Bacilli bacterium]